MPNDRYWGAKPTLQFPRTVAASEGHRAILIEEIADDVAIRIRRDPL